MLEKHALIRICHGIVRRKICKNSSAFSRQYLALKLNEFSKISKFQSIYPIMIS